MKDLQDIIEIKGMNFSQGNIFKAIFRAGENHHSSYERDLHKIIFFADRELKRIERDRQIADNVRMSERLWTLRAVD